MEAPDRAVRVLAEQRCASSEPWIPLSPTSHPSPVRYTETVQQGDAAEQAKSQVCHQAINKLKKRRGKRVRGSTVYSTTNSSKSNTSESNTLKCKDHIWSVYQLNIRGLASKKSSLESILASMNQSPNLLVLSETHKKFESKVTIPGYNSYSRNRKEKSHGGIVTSVRDDEATDCLKVTEGKKVMNLS